MTGETSQDRIKLVYLVLNREQIHKWVFQCDHSSRPNEDYLGQEVCLYFVQRQSIHAVSMTEESVATTEVLQCG